MNTSEFLAYLKGVKQTGRGQWKACCPAHDDKSPSLSIRETEDGRTLLKCFAGCTVYEIVSTVGLSMSDLYPDNPDRDPKFKPRKPRLDGWPVVEAVSHEALIVAMAAEDMSRNKPLSPEDLARVKQASERIQRAVGEANAIR